MKEFDRMIASLISSFNVKDAYEKARGGTICGLVPALMILVFLAAIVLGFFAYSKLVKWAIDRFNLEEKMDPIFSSGRKGRGKTE